MISLNENIFMAKTLKEERARPQDINVNVRLNTDWQAALRSFKEQTGQENDGTAFKLALEIANNVLHSLFSGKIRSRLTLERQARNSQSSPKE